MLPVKLDQLKYEFKCVYASVKGTEIPFNSDSGGNKGLECSAVLTIMACRLGMSEGGGCRASCSAPSKESLHDVSK
jgi:hypothetical protein